MAENKEKMMSDDDVVGHKTFIEKGGVFRHEPLLRGEADRLLAKADAEQKRREELMPDEQSAIEMLWGAHNRLKALGWNDACYCPKDGSEFLVLEPGSTGQFVCTYRGEWPRGSYWTHDADLACVRRIRYFSNQLQGPHHDRRIR